MTDKQINQAIAKACGWRDIIASTAPPEFRRRATGRLGNFQHKQIPDFCTDLNAMHQAEKSLKGYEQIHTYVWHLNNRKDWETDFKLMEVHISARDRAEAFLRALGKWEEVQND